MKTILSILLTRVCFSAFGATTDIQQATVTLPYSELLGLLEQANFEEDKKAKA